MLSKSSRRRSSRPILLNPIKQVESATTVLDTRKPPEIVLKIALGISERNAELSI